MTYGSVASGIEAVTCAWHPLGFSPAWFSEIDPFPCAVLKHHYPDVPNRGDMTKYKEWPDGAIDILVGGTPCQSFSVAGLRRGLDDPRGSLMLVYLAIARRYRPTWIVWENVPGVLSSNGGRDFGTFLGGLAELGYGFSYAVLDAQWFGVPQRRRRVFVVGYLGDWRPAAAVLFESSSLRGDSAPSREAGQRIAASLTRGTDGNGRRQEDDVNIVANPILAKANSSHDESIETYIPDVSLAMKARDAKGPSSDGDGDGLPLLAMPRESRPIPFDTTQITHPENRSNPQPGDPAPSLARGGHAPSIAHALRAEHDASEDGTGRGVPLVAGTLAASGAGTDRPAGQENEPDFCLANRIGVRRLTPRECERLQGFPDHYTAITYRKKPAADGPRYRALGNSMAVPVMRWIGERIQKVNRIVLDDSDGKA